MEGVNMARALVAGHEYQASCKSFFEFAKKGHRTLDDSKTTIVLNRDKRLSNAISATFNVASSVYCVLHRRENIAG